MTRSFVTGSHKYGTPTAKSDIDLVVLVSPADLLKLQAMADKEPGLVHEHTKGGLKEEQSDGGPQSDTLRFGKLNLIAVTWDKAFEAWEEGTNELFQRMVREGPIQRDDAIKLFKSLRAKLADHILLKNQMEG